MDLAVITKEIIAFTGTFNPWLIISLFILLVLNEFGFFIPCLLETVWILVGFNLHANNISLYQAVLLILTSLAGRIIGSYLLFRLSGLSSGWITKIYQRWFKPTLTDSVMNSNSLPARLLRKTNLLSPYPVAFGRLLWLKIPLTMTLGIKNHLKALVLGVILSSFVSDTAIVVIGYISGSIKLNTFQAVTYSMGGLITIYAVIFIIRKLVGIAHSSTQS